MIDPNNLPKYGMYCPAKLSPPRYIWQRRVRCIQIAGAKVTYVHSLEFWEDFVEVIEEL